jgi:mannose-6-phosphate isomerase-like protein (cupin superfamily)
MKWFVSPVTIPGAANAQGEVIINPGKGHVRHLHEHADELIYVISGTGRRRSATKSSRSPGATCSTSRWPPCTPR